MRWKWPATLAGVLLGLAALAYGLWFLLSGDALLREASRADVPGTNLTVVLYKDEKDLTRYRVLTDGEKPAKEARIFGGPGNVAILPIMERGRDWVRMMWNSESGLLFIDFDLKTCEVMRDTSGSQSAFRIERCRRTE